TVQQCTPGGAALHRQVSRIESACLPTVGHTNAPCEAKCVGDSAQVYVSFRLWPSQLWVVSAPLACYRERPGAAAPRRLPSAQCDRRAVVRHSSTKGSVPRAAAAVEPPSTTRRSPRMCSCLPGLSQLARLCEVLLAWRFTSSRVPWIPRETHTTVRSQ